MAAATGLGVLAGTAAWEGPLPAAAGGAIPWQAGNGGALVLAGLITAASIAGLLLARWWAWLLLAGCVLVLPAAAAPYAGFLRAHPMLGHLGRAGAVLVLLALLALAGELMRARAEGAGAALAGSAVGVGLVAAVLAGPGWLTATPWLDELLLALSVAGVAGAVAVPVMMSRQRTGFGNPGMARHGTGDLGGDPRVIDADTTSAGPWPGRRIAVAGVLAALVTFLPAVVTLDRLAGLLSVSADSLARRGYVLTGVVGTAMLACAATAVLVAGRWAGAAAAAVAAVQVGVTAPVILGLFGTAFHRGWAAPAALLGLALGAAAGSTRWREALAAGGNLLVVLVLLVAAAATGGAPEKVVEQGRWVPAALLLALLVATLTCTAAAVAPLTSALGATAAALGVIAVVLATGGRQAMTLTQYSGGRPVSGYLDQVHDLESSMALLSAAALMVGVLAVARLLFALRSASSTETT